MGVGHGKRRARLMGGDRAFWLPDRTCPPTKGENPSLSFSCDREMKEEMSDTHSTTSLSNPRITLLMKRDRGNINTYYRFQKERKRERARRHWTRHPQSSLVFNNTKSGEPFPPPSTF